jgi:glycogen synthase
MKSWNRDWTVMSVFFNGDEIASITRRLKNLKISNLVFCSLESRFAKAGGLASVTTNILPYLKEVNHIPNVILISPYFPNIMKKSKLTSSGVFFNVPFGNKSVSAELFEYTWNYKQPAMGSLKEYYLKADGFFESGNKLKNPYIYDENDKEKNVKAMDENAMFYCKAVPYVLNSLGIKQDIVVHLHEWQTALIALTAKKAMIDDVLHSCGTVQTMHNSFDSSIPWKLLERVDDKANKLKLTGFAGNRFSAYQIGLQLVDAPVTTVSDNFARELTSDVLQSKYYAPHLQNILIKNKTAGVNNGMFTEFSRDYPNRENHTINEIQKIKLKKRKALLKLLSVYKPAERFGGLTYQNRSITGLPVSVPIIVMSGRLDPVQKGYDILLQAVERFAKDEIKVILAPLPVASSDLDYFYEIACKCKGNVTVYPLRMERGYYELQAGSTFGIMPSIYEPFGAAVEYMACGTVNIGRSTGGLIDQIDKNCGFLYKEDPVYYTLENIKSFIKSSDIVQKRKANALAISMADKLYEVLIKAIDVYQNNPDKYYNMISNGFAKARKFNWEINARRYNRVYRMISKA